MDPFGELVLTMKNRRFQKTVDKLNRQKRQSL